MKERLKEEKKKRKTDLGRFRDFRKREPNDKLSTMFEEGKFLDNRKLSAKQCEKAVEMFREKFPNEHILHHLQSMRGRLTKRISTVCASMSAWPKSCAKTENETSTLMF